MIRTLRKRPRPDNLVSQQRRATNRTGRIVYLALLCAFTLAVLNFLFGDLVFLRADGQVLRDRTTIAATYIARVDSVDVKQGQAVKPGDPVLHLQSAEMLERLAELSASRARLAAKAAEFRIRSEMVKRLLPIAEQRASQTAKVLTQFEQLSDAKLVTSARYDDAMTARYGAQQELVKLQAEEQSLSEELDTLELARADAAKALRDLRAHYSEGRVRAPVEGSVGTLVPSAGDVYRPGEPMLSIYSGEAYVLAYLPRRYLFTIATGMKVTVKSGRKTSTGVITQILPVTDALPKEFQNTFKPQDRSQLARIRLMDPQAFPLHDKVQLLGAQSIF